MHTFDIVAGLCGKTNNGKVGLTQIQMYLHLYLYLFLRLCVSVSGISVEVFVIEYAAIKINKERATTTPTAPPPFH